MASEEVEQANRDKALRLQAEGNGVGAIAARMGATEGRVRRWLGEAEPAPVTDEQPKPRRTRRKGASDGS